MDIDTRAYVTDENIDVPTHDPHNHKDPSPLRSRLNILKFSDKKLFRLTKEGRVFKLKFSNGITETYAEDGTLISRIAEPGAVIELED